MDIEYEVDGLVLRAKTWGNKNGYPVLGLHGWLDNACTFDKIAPLFSPDIYFIAIDLAGHGLSDHRDANSSYYLWDYAADVLKVLDVLGHKKISVIAHSMGTGIACVLASAISSVIEKMVFIDGLGPPFVAQKEEEVVINFYRAIRQLRMAKKTKLYGFSSPETAQFSSVTAAIEDRVNNPIGKISHNAVANLLNRALVKLPNGYRWSHDPRIVLPERYRITESQAQAFIQAITCQTLIVLGKQGLFSKGMFKARLSKFQQGKIHWMEGGHHLHLEESHDKIALLINEFLQKEINNENY